MSSASEAKIAISLSGTDKNKAYARNLPEIAANAEIVLCGDVIKGQVRMSLSKSMRHRGITVKIVQRCISDTGILAEQAMSAVQLAKGGKVERSFCADFSFPTSQMKTLTYFGSMSMVYYVVVNVSRLILSDLAAEKMFVFLRPRAPTSPGEQLRLWVKRDNEVDVKLTASQTSYATDAAVDGSVELEASDEVARVSLVLTSIETFKYGGPKVIETVICEYQLVDGAPLSRVSAPFLFQLAPLKVWPSGIPESIMYVEYRIGLLVCLKSGEKVSTSGRLDLFSSLVN